MPDCEMLATCPFFNDKMKDMPGTAKIYKEKYCKTNNKECARYSVLKSKGKEYVPPDMFPNMLDWASKIIGTT